jgi:hypothetical protein
MELWSRNFQHLPCRPAGHANAPGCVSYHVAAARYSICVSLVQHPDRAYRYRWNRNLVAGRIVDRKSNHDIRAKPIRIRWRPELLAARTPCSSGGQSAAALLEGEENSSAIRNLLGTPLRPASITLPPIVPAPALVPRILPERIEVRCDLPISETSCGILYSGERGRKAMRPLLGKSDVFSSRLD